MDSGCANDEAALAADFAILAGERGWSNATPFAFRADRQIRAQEGPTVTIHLGEPQDRREEPSSAQTPAQARPLVWSRKSNLVV